MNGDNEARDGDESVEGVYDSDVENNASLPLSVSWQASEYIHHPKQNTWYLGMVGVVALVTAGTYILTRDWFAPLVIAIMGVTVLVYGGKQPRTLSYSIDPSGLQVEQKFFPFEQFRSFSVIDEGAMTSIMLSPLKRFMTPISLYYEPKDEENIISILSQHLPHSQSRPDIVERVSNRLRF